MPTFTIFYTWTESGRGRIEIPAENEEQARKLFEGHEWNESDEELIDSDHNLKAVLEGSRSYADFPETEDSETEDDEFAKIRWVLDDLRSALCQYYGIEAEQLRISEDDLGELAGMITSQLEDDSISRGWDSIDTQISMYEDQLDLETKCKGEIINA